MSSHINCVHLLLKERETTPKYKRLYKQTRSVKGWQDECNRVQNYFCFSISAYSDPRGDIHKQIPNQSLPSYQLPVYPLGHHYRHNPAA